MFSFFKMIHIKTQLGYRNSRCDNIIRLTPLPDELCACLQIYKKDN